MRISRLGVATWLGSLILTLIPTLLWSASDGTNTPVLSPPLQLDGPSESLDVAKTLYQTGRFDEALTELQSTILTLEKQAQSDDGPSSSAQALLEEAHLHLGLAYVAVDDGERAEKAFAELLRLAPTRQLDPDIHAPKVIEIFKKALTTVENEQPVVTPAELAVNEAIVVLEDYKKAFGARNIASVQRVRSMGDEAAEQLDRLFASLRSVDIELESCEVLESSDSSVQLRCLQKIRYTYQGGQQQADERWATYSLARLGGLMTIRNIGDFERN